MVGALDGVRVIEAADSIAGHFLGQLLADQGADVLMVEHPKGCRFQDRPEYATWNRGKRLLTLDLESTDGRNQILDLVSRADVVITDRGPAESEKFQLRFEDFETVNQRVIHIWLAPYGEQGPLRDLPADDALAEALGGNFASQPGSHGGPVFITLPIASYCAAILASSALCAALLERVRSGRGQQVTVSLLAGALAMHTGASVRILEAETVSVASTRRLNPQGDVAGYRLYKAEDGWLMLACASNVFYNKLLVAMDLVEVLSEERFVQGPWLLDADAQRDLGNMLADIISRQPRAHWLQLLEAHDVPAAPVQQREDYINDPQVLHNGYMLSLDDAQLGPIITASSPISFSQSKHTVTRTAPNSAEDMATISEGWSSSGVPQVTAMPRSVPPLANIRVLDLTSFIAGSACPSLLADYGADVIKVESFEGDPFRPIGLGFAGWNRGKRGIVLDLKTDRGLGILHDLVGTADVLVENFRVGVASRIGVDYETIRGLNPAIVYCSILGWGDSGPSVDRPAFDPIFQALSGAQSAQGGDGPPVFIVPAISDYSAAYLGAFAITAALWRRQSSGVGQRVMTTLAGSSMAMQSGEFVFTANGVSLSHCTPGGHDLAGISAAYRLYECSDGWVFVACTTEAQWLSFIRALGQEASLELASWEAASDPSNFLKVACEVEVVLRSNTVAAWLERLLAEGTPCAPVVALAESLRDEQARANSMETSHQHAAWGHLAQTGSLVKFERTPGLLQRAAPLLGEHTDEVLQSIGISKREIMDLKRSKIVL